MIVTNFPKAVRVIEHTLIPLKDGTTLAARIWLPDDAEQNPVPAGGASYHLTVEVNGVPSTNDVQFLLN